MQAITVSTEDDGTWMVVCRPGAPGSGWLGVRIYKPGRRTGREKRTYWTGYNPEQGRLARSSDERCMFKKRPALWAAVTEAMGARFGRTRGEYAHRLLTMLSSEDRERLLRELTKDERRRLRNVLEGAGCMIWSDD